MMPAISTGRVDAILSGMTDTASRQDTATFVDYLRNGPRFFVQQSRAAEFRDTTAFCGKKVGASRRTSFPKLIAAWSDANCAANPIQFVGTEGSADARTQLRQGRIDAAVQGGETLPYMMDLEPGDLCPGRRRLRHPVHRACVGRQEEGAAAGGRRGPRLLDRGRHLPCLAGEVEIDRLRHRKGDHQCWTVKRSRAFRSFPRTPRRRLRTIRGRSPIHRRCSCRSTWTRRAPGPARTRYTPSASSP